MSGHCCLCRGVCFHIGGPHLCGDCRQRMAMQAQPTATPPVIQEPKPDSFARRLRRGRAAMRLSVALAALFLLQGCAALGNIHINPPSKCLPGQKWCSEQGGGCIAEGLTCGPFVPPPPHGPGPECFAAGKAFECWDHRPGHPWEWVCKPDTSGNLPYAPSPDKCPDAPPAPPAGHGKDDPVPELKNIQKAPTEGTAVAPEGFDRDINRAIDVACGRGCEGAIPDPQNYVKVVRDTMRSFGYLAAYNWAAGNDGVGSELGVWRDCIYADYQVENSNAVVRRPPGAFRSRADIVGCGGQPPPPPSSACSKNPSDVNRWEIEAKWHGGSIIDTTPIAVGDTSPCDHPELDQNGKPRFPRKCWLSGEKGNQACADKLWGKTTFSKPQGSNVVFITPSDPGDGPNDNMAKITGGDGVLTICGSNARGEGSCRDIHVVGGIPPCDVIAGDPNRACQ